MILDLPRFVAHARPFWNELDQILARLERAPDLELTLAESERLHYLYQRASADLLRVRHVSSERELRGYLEQLIGRAYSEIHAAAERRPLTPWRWFTRTFPRTVRRHAAAMYLALGLTALGCGFGVIALSLDPEAKAVIFPFEHLQGKPSERVALEMKEKGKRLAGGQSRFAAQLMTHNTQVSFTALALGMTFGVGTIVLLFYNGVILGAVCFDYIRDGQGAFLAGWLLPHGAVEIPAILLASQAGLILGYALIGWNSRLSRSERMRAIAPDLATLAGGAALLLIWAGIVESFFSQYHEPVVPYAAKIAFGSVELAAVLYFFLRAGADGDQHD